MSVVKLWTPGAATSTSAPKFEPHQCSPSALVLVFGSSNSLLAETANTLASVAGNSTPPELLPAATIITQPFPPRPSVRALSNAFETAFEGAPPPQLLLRMSAPLRQAQLMAFMMSEFLTTHLAPSLGE